MSDIITIEQDADGIAVLTWNQPDQPVNVFTEASIDALTHAIETVLNDETIKGVVFASAKDVFHVGADLDMALLLASLPVGELFDRVMTMNRLFRRMETSGKPFVAAIEGHAMGGGLELALACHARILADDSRIQLSLPEAKLGLMPGFGGTQRLTRLLPLMEAMPALATGKTFRSEKAKKLGLVTELAETGTVLARAKAWAKDNPNAKQPWDIKGAKLPSGAVHSPANFQFFVGASAQARKNTYGNYPAPQAILEAVYQGLQMPIDQALKVEARKFISIARSETAHNMIHTLFFGMNDANALKRRPEGFETRQFTKVGLIGAGLMGAGIAYQAAKCGIDVVLLDRDQAAADKGKDYSLPLLDKAVKRGRLTEEEKDAHLSRITPTTDYAALKDCDIVVEAVFESKEIKRDVLRAVEAAVSDTAIIASNTSTIPITELAGFVQNPERFIGLHFFSPVEHMPLLEIISGEQTTAQTLAQAFDFCRAIKKTPIDVNDGRAFYTTRVVSAYMAEGMTMLAEGMNPAIIENAGKTAGMPMGPLRLTDMVNLDLGVKVADQARADLGPSFVEPLGVSAARKLVNAGRLGEKTQAGFYDHKDGQAKLWDGLGTYFPLNIAQPTLREAQDRLMTIQAIETLRCLDENVLKTPEDADLGSILGWGFAPHTGGVARYIDSVGAGNLLALSETLTQRHGDQFSAPQILHTLAKDNQKLHAA